MTSLIRTWRALPPLRRAIVVAAGAAVVGSVMSWLNSDKWDESHDYASQLSDDRPECPVDWSSVPLFFPDPQQRDTEWPRLGRIPPARARFVRTGNVVYLQAAGASGGPGSSPAGPIANVAGPITNIPEFHDCQKFVKAEAVQFDSLHAIFASFRMDSIVDSLGWDNVTWTTQPPNVLDHIDGGRFHALALGTTTITATSTADPLRAAHLTVKVVPGGGSPVTAIVSPSTSSLDTVFTTLAPTLTVLPQMGKPTQTTHAVAAIYAYGPGYEPLGIEANFSCLYLYFNETGDLRAKVIHVAELSQAADACFTAADPKRPELGRELRVIRRPGFNAPDYPAVARWDWDRTNSQQYIGMMCGDAWCDIGPNDRPFDPTPGYSPTATATPEARRVVGVKGWYDEQDLAMPAVGSSQMVPSGLRGTVIPAPNLFTQTKSSFFATAAEAQAGTQWVTVAHVAIRAESPNPEAALQFYSSKLNLRPASPDAPLSSMNRLDYCYGTRSRCGVPNSVSCDDFVLFVWSNSWFGWPVKRLWGRVIAAGASNGVEVAPVYRCVTRRGHEDYQGEIPATARWRWILGDDTTWTQCVQGCCEVDT